MSVFLFFYRLGIVIGNVRFSCLDKCIVVKSWDLFVAGMSDIISRPETVFFIIPHCYFARN